jgi:hypothetical protein
LPERLQKTLPRKSPKTRHLLDESLSRCAISVVDGQASFLPSSRRIRLAPSRQIWQANVMESLCARLLDHDGASSSSEGPN